MPRRRPFRFGVQSGLSGASKPGDWADLARRVEALGYSSLSIPDHFTDQLAPVPAMTAAAAATTTLKVGALVFGNDYRHPVVLAKEIATIDLLSDGRVEFGLGAGWMTTDYRQAGIGIDPPGPRIERMGEALEICRGLWGDGAFSFDGGHYRVAELDGQPKPVQRPHPPILIGGGRPRVLAMAGREADIVGINPSLRAGEVGPEAVADVVAERVDEKVGWVRDAAGDRFDAIELNLLVQFAMVVDNRMELLEATAPAFGLTAEQAMGSPYVLVGTVDEICEDLRTWRDRWGISYWVVHVEVVDALAPVVERLSGT
ncbi:MAG: TIGR03621 family F420-dependent LLM class oxidoreductase [Acidimicrobiales bacterium]